MDRQLSERKSRNRKQASNNEMEYLLSIRKSLEQQDKGELNDALSFIKSECSC